MQQLVAEELIIDNGASSKTLQHPQLYAKGILNALLAFGHLTGNGGTLQNDKNDNKILASMQGTFESCYPFSDIHHGQWGMPFFSMTTSRSSIATFDKCSCI